MVEFHHFRPSQSAVSKQRWLYSGEIAFLAAMSDDKVPNRVLQTKAAKAGRPEHHLVQKRRDEEAREEHASTHARNRKETV